MHAASCSDLHPLSPAARAKAGLLKVDQSTQLTHTKHLQLPNDSSLKLKLKIQLVLGIKYKTFLFGGGEPLARNQNKN